MFKLFKENRFFIHVQRTKGGANTSVVVLTKMADMCAVMLAKMRWNVRCAGNNDGEARRQLEPQYEYEV